MNRKTVDETAGNTAENIIEPSRNLPPLLSPKDAATLLGIEEHTLAIWRSNKRYELPYVKVGRLVRYRLSDLHGFVEARTVAR